MRRFSRLSNGSRKGRRIAAGEREDGTAKGCQAASRVAVVVVVTSGLFAGCTAPAPEPVTPSGGVTTTIALEPVADGFVAPVALEIPDDASGRRFVVDQIGLVRIIRVSGELAPTPFLDLRDRVVSLSPSYDERGLLGLAFHPDYAVNGRVYVYYTASSGTEFSAENRVSEFRVSSSDPDLADLDSERVLLAMGSPQSNHNGGQLAFGPDGYLYIGTGDGGAGNDVGLGHTAGLGNGQDKSSLLGKILRIDVDDGDPYGVPADNPLVGDPEAAAEVYALGLRNPWRFSFDSGGARRLFVGDVGQNLFEEVNIVQSNGNYGWNAREGAHCFDSGDANPPSAECRTVDAADRPLVDPIIEYGHRSTQGRPSGISVIGGYVYRGDSIPALSGQYIFGDWSTGFIIGDGSLLAAEEDGTGQWALRELKVADTSTGRIGRFVLAFGRDGDGELYLLTSQRTGPSGTTGQVHKITATDSTN